MLFMLTIKLQDVQVITFATLVSLLAKQFGGSFTSWISGWQPLFPKTETQQEHLCLPSARHFLLGSQGWLRGFQTFLLPVPLGAQGGDNRFVTITLLHVILNSSAHPAVTEHSLPRSVWSPSISSQLCPATHPCIPFYAACFLVLTARCWPWQSSQVLWKRAFPITGQPLYAWRGFQF